jgi:hypothetical protein
VQHQELLVQNHAFPLLAELGEEVPEATAAGDVEPEGLGEVLLRVLGGVGADVVTGRDGDAPALEIDPGVVHPAIGLVHLAEGAAERAGAGPVPVVIQEAVTQLVGDQPDQHGPGDLVLPSLAHDVPLLNLDGLGIARVHPGHAGPEQHAVPPVADARDQQQPPDPGERAGDEVAAGRVEAAPGAEVHPVVHAPVAVGALPLEQILLVPALGSTVPGTEAHGILHAAAAPPVAARVHPEPAGRLERLLAGITLLVDVGVAPGTEGKAVGDHPAAAVALRARHPVQVLPLLGSPTVGTVRPEFLERVAADAVVFGVGRGLAALTRGHSE